MNDWASPWASTTNAPITPLRENTPDPIVNWEGGDVFDTFENDAQWGDLQENIEWTVKDSTDDKVGDLEPVKTTKEDLGNDDELLGGNYISTKGHGQLFEKAVLESASALTASAEGWTSKSTYGDIWSEASNDDPDEPPNTSQQNGYYDTSIRPTDTDQELHNTSQQDISINELDHTAVIASPPKAEISSIHDLYDTTRLSALDLADTTSSSNVDQSHDDRTSSETVRASAVDSTNGDQAPSLANGLSADRRILDTEDDEFGDFEETAQGASGLDGLVLDAENDTQVPILNTAAHFPPSNIGTSLAVADNENDRVQRLRIANAEKFVSEFLRQDTSRSDVVDRGTSIDSAVDVPDHETQSEAAPNSATLSTPEEFAAIDEKKASSIKFVINHKLVQNLLPTSSDEQESIEEVDEEILASISARKTWHRISRLGTLRAYDSGDTNDYVRISWPGSAVEKTVLKTVGRWTIEDRMNGGAPLFGSGTKAFGPNFDWTNSSLRDNGHTSKVQPIILPKPSNVRKSSVMPASALSLDNSTKFSWSSTPATNKTAHATAQDSLISGVVNRSATKSATAAPWENPETLISRAQTKNELSSDPALRRVPEGDGSWGALGELDKVEPLLQILSPSQSLMLDSSESVVARPPLMTKPGSQVPEVRRSRGTIAVDVTTETLDSWGDFEAFESAQPDASTFVVVASPPGPNDLKMLGTGTTSEVNATTQDERSTVQEAKPSHVAAVDIVADTDNDWGDFGDFESSEADIEGSNITTAVPSAISTKQPSPFSPSPDLSDLSLHTFSSAQLESRVLEASSPPAQEPMLEPQLVQDPWGDLSAFDKGNTTLAQPSQLLVKRVESSPSKQMIAAPKAKALPKIPDELSEEEQRSVEEIIQGLPDLAYMLR